MAVRDTRLASKNLHRKQRRGIKDFRTQLVRCQQSEHELGHHRLVDDRLGVSRSSLQQVLLNTIINGMEALDATKPAARRVTVTVRRDGPQAVEVTVADAGHGIPADALARVFDPFVTTKPNGMGMVLPISRTIIEAPGRRLWAENRGGGGAAFRFTLPIAAEATAP